MGKFCAFKLKKKSALKSRIINLKKARGNQKKCQFSDELELQVEDLTAKREQLTPADLKEYKKMKEVRKALAEQNVALKLQLKKVDFSLTFKMKMFQSQDRATMWTESSSMEALYQKLKSVLE